MKKLILILILASATPAMAAEMISESDFTAAADKRFAAIDANGDGRISKDEYLAAMSKKFDASDTDHDGALSKAEFMAIKMKERNDMLVPEKK